MQEFRQPRTRSLPVKPSQRKATKCLFFRRYGRCSFGSYCRFRHEEPVQKYELKKIEVPKNNSVEEFKEDVLILEKKLEEARSALEANGPEMENLQRQK